MYNRSYYGKMGLDFLKIYANSNYIGSYFINLYLWAKTIVAGNLRKPHWTITRWNNMYNKTSQAKEKDHHENSFGIECGVYDSHVSPHESALDSSIKWNSILPSAMNACFVERRRPPAFT